MDYLLLDFFKILVPISIFYVWVPRQDNIRKEFQDYNYPDWLRDLTGIFKLTLSKLLSFYKNDYGIEIFILFIC